MKIAAFGDIHSNHFALEACLAEADRIGIDGIVFLGDYVSDCACPQKTLSLLREIALKHQCWFIRGNREEYMMDHADGRNEWYVIHSRDRCFIPMKTSLIVISNGSVVCPSP